MYCYLAIVLLANNHFLSSSAGQQQLEDAYPGGKPSYLTGFLFASPRTFGWNEGTCQLNGQNTSIAISRISSGNWFFAHHEFLGRLDRNPLLSPFSVLFYAPKCTFVHISPNRQELTMHFGCKDALSKNFER